MVEMVKLLLILSLIVYGVTQKISVQNYIVGGKPITIEEVPYQVSLQYYGSHLCGGSIISHYHIVTACHCIISSDKRQYKVIYGTTYFKIDAKYRTVSQIYRHPNYNSNTIDNDIAVLRMSQSIPFNEQANSINLPRPYETVPTGTIARITGWGVLEPGNSELPMNLQYIDVPKISQRDCQLAYSAASITDNMNCYGIKDVGGEDACQGDSGGPVAINGILYGLTSWGEGCALPKYPGVYTNVANYVNWIRGILKQM